MGFELDLIKDKVEFFESQSLRELEKKIQQQIENNQAIMLRVHHVNHHTVFTPEGKPYYTASVHFKS
ncbi:YrzA family protein [Jeotgalibacillus sp. JSM ZJ347]|uniref:YrzA family protein n=1 Tax=Jeotgalibacillus sp. JSM ZJ347 TaxID=3342117 RepID=UPI0035A98028